MKTFVSKILLCSALSFCLCATIIVRAQELYPNAEAASNGPQDVLRLRVMTAFQNHDAFMAAKGMYTLTNDFMLAGTLNFSSRLADKFPSDFTVTTPLFRSATLYGKYRLFTDDAPHKHVRLAAFGEADIAPQPVSHETYMMGIKNGVTAGLIGTVLINKTAVSGTASWFQPVQFAGAGRLPSGIVNYALSVGHLLLPTRYVSYEQINLNFYCEFLGNVFDGMEHQITVVDGQEIHGEGSRRFHQLYVAPAVQLIVQSRAKIDLALRVPLVDQYHTSRAVAVMVGFEYYFF